MIRRLETLYGPMFVPDTDSGQYWWLQTTGASPEHEMIEFVSEMLDQMKPGGAVDIGANFGCWSLPLARHAFRVFAFEPQRCVLKAFRQTLAANHLPIELHDCALGSTHRMAKMPDLDPDLTTNFGGVSLDIPHSEHPDAKTYDVQVKPLDDILSIDDRISFIKIDAEGSELDIIKGAQRTIWRWKPPMIVEADHPLTDTQALGAFIQSMNYNVEIFRDNNFICMPV